MMLLAMKHATPTTNKVRVTQRIQHEDDLQHRLSHSKCGQRSVPNASVLEDRDIDENWVIQCHHTPILSKQITN